MIYVKDFIKSAIECFETEKLNGSDEYGIKEFYSGNIANIAVATNLTLETVMATAEKGIHCLMTHHDAWDFVHGMKEKCVELLKKHEITHLWSHLLLDDAEFGTGAALLKELNLTPVGRCCKYDGKYDCGHMGVPKEGISLEQLAKRLETISGEPARFWKNSDKEIKKVAIVTGGGFSTDDLKNALEAGCDTYITGEKLMYTLQYANLVGMNLIVGTHTGTERPGVYQWAKKALGRNESVGIYVITETIGE